MCQTHGATVQVIYRTQDDVARDAGRNDHDTATQISAMQGTATQGATRHDAVITTHAIYARRPGRSCESQTDAEQNQRSVHAADEDGRRDVSNASQSSHSVVAFAQSATERDRGAWHCGGITGVVAGARQGARPMQC